MSTDVRHEHVDAPGVDLDVAIDLTDRDVPLPGPGLLVAAAVALVPAVVPPVVAGPLGGLPLVATAVWVLLAVCSASVGAFAANFARLGRRRTGRPHRTAAVASLLAWLAAALHVVRGLASLFG